MQRIKRPPMRNKIDLADAEQLRAWTRRFRMKPDALQAIVGKVGNSAAAVAKEIELRRISDQPVPVPPIVPAAVTPADAEVVTKL